jgi:hypothetical protein
MWKRRSRLKRATKKPRKGEYQMSTELNKQLVERMLSMIVTGNLAGIENIVAPN